MEQTDWIAADWGNTHLRLWAISQSGAVVGERKVAKGLSSLEPGEWEGVLLETCEGLLPEGQTTEVLICGAAGSRGGWMEVPHRAVPCLPVTGDGAVLVPTTETRLSVRILPGLKQLAPPAVMRSEETQVAGYLAANPGFDGVISLPGTHTKWVHVSAGEVVSFLSTMTGELFGLLANHSILRRTIAAQGDDQVAFLEGVEAAIRDPGKLLNKLITLRARAYLDGLEPVAGRSYLSGLLIGADLTASRAYWLGRDVAVVGAEAIAQSYVLALEAQGVAVHKADGGEMALAGLIAAHAQIR